MAKRFHLFPFRTQKLSSFTSKILGWRRPGKIDRCRHLYAPLAQLVEQLTLNQWVLGSSPRWCIFYLIIKICECAGIGRQARLRGVCLWRTGSSPVARIKNYIIGVDSKEVPPVPIPNTEVKLFHVENTWLATARENR